MSEENFNPPIRNPSKRTCEYCGRPCEVVTFSTHKIYCDSWPIDDELLALRAQREAQQIEQERWVAFHEAQARGWIVERGGVIREKEYNEEPMPTWSAPRKHKKKRD